MLNKVQKVRHLKNATINKAVSHKDEQINYVAKRNYKNAEFGGLTATATAAFQCTHGRP